MHILIAEDLPKKHDRVLALLQSALHDDQLVIDWAKSFRSAIKCLEMRNYDLLILDLVLPVRDGEVPDLKGGKMVISEILAGGSCRKPSHIIGLTAFPDSSSQVAQEIHHNLAHMIIYDETSANWEDSLTTKAKYVQSRLKETSLLPVGYRSDIAILTSSPGVELTAINRIPGFVAEYHQSDELHYYYNTWVRSDGKRLNVIACAAPQMGMTAACATACKMIARWRPRVVAMPGICAGAKDGQSFGDILVAECAFDYGSGKISEQNGNRRFVPRPNEIPIEPSLGAIVQRWVREQLSMDEIKRAWDTNEVRAPRLEMGVLATGAAVVQDKSLVEQILTNSGRVIGIEMEAYGVFQAARLASTPKPQVLVAKSISDFADSNKSDKAQSYAAFTSSQFLYHFFTKANELRFDGMPQACN